MSVNHARRYLILCQVTVVFSVHMATSNALQFKRGMHPVVHDSQSLRLALKPPLFPDY